MTAMTALCRADHSFKSLSSTVFEIIAKNPFFTSTKGVKYGIISKSRTTYDLKKPQKMIRHVYQLFIDQNTS